MKEDFKTGRETLTIVFGLALLPCYLYSIFLRFGVIARESKGAASAEQMVTEDLK